LRKDFVIAPYQVYEGRAAGADAILLIVAALADDQMAVLHALIESLGMAALVEVHNEAELERALRLNPELLGINNRDLKTFEVNLETTARLAARVPATVTLVAESGVFTGAHVRQMAAMGAHAVLVGEALVTAEDTAARVRELSTQLR
jgi:indole-3-glycerol phosphate synthase